MAKTKLTKPKPAVKEGMSESDIQMLEQNYFLDRVMFFMDDVNSAFQVVRLNIEAEEMSKYRKATAEDGEDEKPEKKGKLAEKRQKDKVESKKAPKKKKPKTE